MADNQVADHHAADRRPVYLNLFKIRLPVTGVVSFAHRLTGVIMFISIPFAVYLLDLSVESQQSFQEARLIFEQPYILVLLILLLWSLVHHFYAGIRFLLIDAEIGVDRSQSRIGAWIVLVAEILTLVAIAGAIL